MKKQQYNLIALAIFSACYSQAAAADLRSQCLLGVPQFSGEVIEGDQTGLPVYIEADSAEINQPNSATYLGNVSIQQGNRTLFGEKVRVEQQGEAARYAYIDGRFDYRDNLLNASGQDAAVNLTSKEAVLSSASYQFVGRQGRGTGEQASLNDEKRVLRNATFTSCLPNDKSWQIEASEMVQHVKAEYAEMWHARFKVLGVPVFYSPYLQFPIGDRRRSGLLLPQNVGHSQRDGYTYSQPIYWNIAPNIDATLTPTYYSHRGWQLSPEVRYLTKLGQGKIAGEYLGKDRLATWAEKQRSRHLFFWQHNASFLTNWRLAVDYTRVSDSRYFTDFESAYGSSTDGYATQSFNLGYFQPNYNISVAGKKFQTFDQSGSKPYRVLPQINMNYYRNNLVKNGDFAVFGQISHFANDSKQMPTAWRFHLQPSLNFPLANRFGSLNVETKLYATHYLQKKGTKSTEEVQRSISRVLPQFKIDLSTTLVNQKPLFQSVNQTLEPRVQYLYRPYKDQSKIGSQRQSSLGLGYDSALLQQDYYSLFNDRRYSGLDRIASANQITLGGTTRFFSNKTGAELFNFSAGQIIYLSPSKIDSISENSMARRSSSWVLESNWKFHPKWNWHGSYQYDTRLNETSLANVSLQFKPKADNVVQLNYRYASKHYIDQNLSSNQYGQDIKQIGMVAGWTLTDNLSVMASHYQDIALKKPVESQLGLTYNTCCWSATFYAARRLTATPQGEPDSIRHFYYDNRVGVNFELRFGGSYNSGVSRLLTRGMIPYTEAFNIN